MDQSDAIFKKIVAIIANSSDLESKLPVEELTKNTHLSFDLGYDSIALMSLLYELQESYSRVDENDIVGIKTINDLISNVIKKCV